MSIKLRFTLLLSLLFGGFIATVLVLRHFEQAEREAILERDRQARSQVLSRWIHATTRELPQFAADLAQSEEFASLLVQSDTAAAAQKIVASLAEANLSALWILGSGGKVRVHAAVDQGIAGPELPLEVSAFLALVSETPQPRFFVEHGQTILELCARRIPRNDDPTWIVVARSWNDVQLKALADLTGSTVSLRPAHALAQPPETPGKLVLLRPLHDWQGRAVRVLHVEYEIPEIERTLRSNWRQTLLFVGYGILVLAALTLALHSWVLRPLGRIRDSLATNDTTPAAPLTSEKTEFGRLANLVLSSFEQRAALQREIEERTRTEKALAQSEATLRENLEERARLGRDLHDGVIQSLYAAGMGLAGIRTQLRPEQTEAAARLEQTRGALNETIHDVRNFIVGLEPEALKLKTFSQAVVTLLDTTQSLRPFQSALEIDDAVSEQLSLTQRIHALLIAREAVSNALRHGEARHITIALRRRQEFAEFEITDDGRGFDTATSISPGNGLDNFAQRAHELGGELVVDSKPGQGTRVKLSFSLNL